ncbi:MAG: hypothetical protein DDT39_00053 [Firmicutes bacterium]|nr:hypothetical protein [candidate division NPL-UPA2 bacterium]
MLASTVGELITLFRSEVDDPVRFEGDDGALLWKQADALAYFTEGLDRVLKRTETLYRQAALPVVAGQRLVRLPPTVRHIRDAVLRSTRRQLYEINANDPARFFAASDYGRSLLVADDSPGAPTAYTRDLNANGLWLDRVPPAADTIDIQFSAVLAEPLGLDDDLPVTDAEDQRLVLTFMKYRAYAKQDADTVDLRRSELFRVEFERHLSERAVDLRNVRRAPGTVRIEW